MVSIAGLAERTALDYSRCGGNSARMFLRLVASLQLSLWPRGCLTWGEADEVVATGTLDSGQDIPII
jgi:hypothetical protein